MDTDNSHLSQVIRRACRASGFEPHVRSSCKDFSVIIALVEAGLGVGVLPGWRSSIGRFGLKCGDRPSPRQAALVGHPAGAPIPPDDRLGSREAGTFRGYVRAEFGRAG